MKNPYLRTILIISLILSFLYTFIILFEGSVISKMSYQSNSTSLDDIYVPPVSKLSDEPVPPVSDLEVVKSTKPDVDSTSMWATSIVYIIGFPMIAMFFIFGGGEGAAMGAGIIMEFIGPILVFVSWFLVLYIITYIYSRFKRNHNILSENINIPEKKSSIKGLVIICIICVISLSAVSFGYIVMQEQQVFNNLRGYPVSLASISPERAYQGDLITLKGSGFSKQDMTIWLVDKDQNKYGLLWMGKSSNDTSVQFTLKTQLCSTAGQTNCQYPENFNPGKYVIEIRGGSLPYPSKSFEVLE